MQNSSFNIYNKSQISIVIPTLGGKSLRETIEQINRGSLIPDEILICIPEEHVSKVNLFSYPNVKIVRTSGKGQVRQRSEGFKNALGEFVMQLDDDIVLSTESLRNLHSCLIKLGRGNVIGPIYYEKNTKQPIHKIENGINGFIRNLYFSIIYGARWGAKRMGTLPPLGHGFGVDPNYCRSDLFDTEFLPGGCVLSYKEDLVTENFYPFEGKAYCEDSIHSYLRNCNGIKHWVSPLASCQIDICIAEASLTPKERKLSFQARELFTQLNGHSIIRQRIYQALICLRHFFH